MNPQTLTMKTLTARRTRIVVGELHAKWTFHESNLIMQPARSEAKMILVSPAIGGPITPFGIAIPRR
jgi:hypothetical protein